MASEGGPKCDVVVVLSTDPDALACARRVCVEEGMPLFWLTLDPADLAQMLESAAEESPEERERRRDRIAGIVLDLTPPAERAAPRKREVAMAAAVAGPLSLLGAVSHVALVVVSADRHLEATLRRAGIPLATRVAPDADEASWRHALRHLPAARDALRDVARSRRRARPLAWPSPTAIPLRPRLWFEPDRCALVRDGRSLALTARETALLDLLARAPCRYHGADELARRLTRAGALPIDAHSVVQTITGLRRKLGESPDRAEGILRTRRGVGYGLFPATSDAARTPRAQH